jgi:sugar phosphate isomerase/epimerase
MPTLCANLLNLSERYGNTAPLEPQLDAVAEFGAKLVGLDTGAIKRWLASGGSLESLRAALEQRGLRCYELTYLECASSNPEGGLGAAERIARWAGALDCPWILTASLGEPVSEALVDLFGRVCDAARKHGTGLAWEFFPWAEIDCFGAAHELIRRAGRPNAGVLIDCCHFFNGPDDWSVLESLPLDTIAYVQFTDSIAVAPERCMAEAETCRRFPGEGVFPLERFARTLRSRGFDGVVSTEILSPQTRALGVREYVRRSLESSRRYWP